MNKLKIKISKKELIRLYVKQNYSPYKIARIFSCSFSTITNRLKQYYIPLKNNSLARIKYSKKNFSGDLPEKAYMLGFRLGDLNVYQTSDRSEVIVVRCNTTRIEQLELLEKIFIKYGHVSYPNKIKNKQNSIHINVFLNKSFVFLLPKRDLVESWINKNNECCLAFIAGYFDAEANFGINQNRARVKVDSYDKNILIWIHKWCIKHKILSKLLLLNARLKKELWRFNINEAASLLKFCKLIKLYIKHKKRKNDLNNMIKNILLRKAKGTLK
jgi:hypothetical protein